MKPFVALLLSLLMPVGSLAQPQLNPEGCPVSRTAAFALPHVDATLARNHEVLIVAIGSSSTVSWMSSDIGHSYPAILQDELNERLPRAHVAVINRGVGGQVAAQEVSRLDADVLPVRPQLVIWQVGANDALRDVDVDGFRRVLLGGIARLRGAGIDVVLMDNQRAPRLLASAEDDRIEQVLAEVARQSGVRLFARGALMDQWRAEGFPYARFVAADNLHHNDRGYRCIADALADSIARGVGPRT